MNKPQAETCAFISGETRGEFAAFQGLVLLMMPDGWTLVYPDGSYRVVELGEKQEKP